MVGCRWCRVRDGGAVLLGNLIRDFHGGAVLLGNGMVGFHGGVVLVGNFIVSGETHCKGGFQVVLAR